jgi:hypothetical protein
MQQINNSVNGTQWSTPTKRNANQSVSNNNHSTTVTSSSSNDSLVLESRTTKPLFNDDLIVIERSNRELELKLTPTKQQQQQQHDQKQQQLHHYHQQQMQEQLYQQQLYNQQQQEQNYIQHQKEVQQLQLQQEHMYLNHQKEQQQQQQQLQEQIYLNHQKEQQQKQEQIYHQQQKEQQLKQEQIYHQQQKEQQQQKLKNEDSPSGKAVKNRAIRFTLPSNAKNRSSVVVDTIHNNNNNGGAGFADVIYEECSHADEVERIKSKISRPLSECFSASQDNLDVKSSPQSFPSIGDLPSAADLSEKATFKSLTAQKLMSGLSFNSIDTLLEVNAAAEARSKHNESTETIDFGVI